MLSFGGNAHLWEEEKPMGNGGNSPLEAAWQTAGSGMAGFNDQQQDSEFNIEAWQNGLDENNENRQPTSFTRAASNDVKFEIKVNFHSIRQKWLPSCFATCLVPSASF